VFPWLLFYEDGSAFGWEDGAPHESPPWGAIVVGQRTRGQFKDVLYSGVPWFVYHDDHGCWMEHDDNGYLDVMVHKAHLVSAVRFGRWGLKPQFWHLVKQAQEFARG
jgi:hypothetical protein